MENAARCGRPAPGVATWHGCWWWGFWVLVLACCMRFGDEAVRRSAFAMQATLVGIFMAYALWFVIVVAPS